MSKFCFFVVLATIVLSSSADENPLWANIKSSFQENVLPALKQNIEDNVMPALKAQIETRPELQMFKEFDFSKMSMPQCLDIKNQLGLKFPEQGVNVDNLTLAFESKGEKKLYNILTAARDIMESKQFDTSKKLFVFIHGWLSDPTKSNGITQALRDTGNTNILALDSTSYLMTWNYLQSSSYVKFIGQKLAEVLIALNEVGLDRKNIHIIGHSLGAQIAGFAGKHFYNNTETKIGRISGLDPAGPCFSELTNDYHIYKNDADFVDIIHSNAGIAGFSAPVGHVDFYPNGGSYMAGCNIIATCDHGRSMEYYAESIRKPDAFPAVKCQSWEEFTSYQDEKEVNNMGFGARPDVEGSFYCRTAPAADFGMYARGTKNRDEEEKPNDFFGAIKSFFG